MTKSKACLIADLERLSGRKVEEWKTWPNYKILVEIAKYKNQESDSDNEQDFTDRMGSRFRK
jgi:hypothetical protein